MPTRRLLLSACFAAAATTALAAQDRRLDSVDAFVRTQMAQRKIPGLSLAIIQDGKILAARGYGVADLTSGAPVTPATLFQAGSISKPVSALAALHLVEAGKLSLDEDVNQKLKSWKVPGNSFTTTEKVTLRRILSHSAGLTVHGFPGYDVAEPMATLGQVLDGAPPANTPAIRVDTLPGAIWRYSGGGFTVMQQLLIDVTGKPFPAFLQETVLAPAGMSASSFEQPEPKAREALMATGYYADRTPVRGHWHVYPEMAAAGLWTNATDLAKFALEVQATLTGKGHGIISQAMARQYVTPQKAQSGLGIAVAGTGPALNFSHGGRDEGFDAQLLAFAETGQGVAVMINANDNSRFMGRLLSYIGRQFGWPDATSQAPPPAVHAVAIGAERLARYAGYYEMTENQMGTLVPNAAASGLSTLSDDLPNEEFLAVDSARFSSLEREFPFAVSFGAGGEVTGLLWGPRARPIARVGPLLGGLAPRPDPNPELTDRVRAALNLFGAGGAALQADTSLTTPGARKDFAGQSDARLAGVHDFQRLGSSDVRGRGLHRHGNDIATVLYFRAITAMGPRNFFVYLTADGKITDYDLVPR